MVSVPSYPTLTPREVARFRRWRAANPAAWAEALREAKREQFEEAQFTAIAVLRKRMNDATPAAETRAAIAILRQLNALVRHGFAKQFLEEDSSLAEGYETRTSVFSCGTGILPVPDSHG